MGSLALDSKWGRDFGARKGREEGSKVVLHRIGEMHVDSLPILQIKDLKTYFVPTVGAHDSSDGKGGAKWKGGMVVGCFRQAFRRGKRGRRGKGKERKSREDVGGAGLPRSLARLAGGVDCPRSRGIRSEPGQR
jgi:hypothetical protein